MLSIGSFRSALSAERLGAYARPGDADELDSVARYLWNLALCSALQPALHILEVTVRNHLFKVSRRIVDATTLSFDRIPCWLDARPSLPAERERQAVEEAKAKLEIRGSPMTEGRLVSALGFGFWVSLCKRPYEQGRTVGPLNLGGSLERIADAVAMAELAVDKQATVLLMPVGARRELMNLEDDVWTKVNIEFYRDAQDEVFKVLE